MPSFSRKMSARWRPDEKPSTQTVVPRKPGLAVDTSFSSHKGTAPEQVFPQNVRLDNARFVSLTDLNGLGINGASPRATKRPGQDEQLESKVFVPLRGGLPPNPAAHRQQATQTPDFARTQPQPATERAADRIKALRPSPLDISPSDRAIPIGIALPSAMFAGNNSYIPRSGSGGSTTQTAAKELPTPTIVITPAREEFDTRFTASPDDIRTESGRRPVSSVYSVHPSHEYGKGAGCAPPVPPLPLYAAQSNASLQRSRGLTAQVHDSDDTTRLTTSRNPNALSLQTMFEEDGAISSSYAASKRLSIASNATSARRSKGWWNVITSPFSPSGRSMMASLRSPSLAEDGQEKEPILPAAADMACSKTIFEDREPDEPQSAPGAPASSNTSSRLIPKRSDTAPGALDLGSIGELNIYQLPGEGTAASYYDGFGAAARSRAIDGDQDWSPSQSCYRGSVVEPDAQPEPMRDSEFYAVPEDGEAAEYYNENMRFPSLVPYGAGFGDRGLEWDPRNSVAPQQKAVTTDPDETDEPSAESSSKEDSDSQPDACSSATSENESELDNAETAKSEAEIPARPPYPDAPYPDEKNPFDDAFQDSFSKGQPDLSASSGGSSAFKDFSGTHPAAASAQFPPSPEVMTSGNAGPENFSRNNSEDVFSPFTVTETPQVEEARTGTFLGPESHREIEVASTRQRDMDSPAPSAGLGAAVMTTQAPGEPEPEQNVGTMPGYLAPSHYDARQSEHDDSGYALSDHDSEHGLFPPPGQYSEKRGVAEEELNEEGSGPRRSRPSCSRRCCYIITGSIVSIALILFAVLFATYFPFHSNGPIQAQWLNLTGFPPLPTGIATVIQPKAVNQVSGCVAEQALWSCAVPTGEQGWANKQTLPDFRFQIRFRGDILPKNETAIMPSNSTLSRRGLGQASGAGDLARRGLLTNWKWDSAPSPPSVEEQHFLGRTTDNASLPYVGEQTPFYISLLNASALSASGNNHLGKRDFHYPYPTHTAANSTSPTSTFKFPGQSSSAATTNPSTRATPSINDSIPQAATGGNGYPAAAELYPLAYAQPLRLYNRGLSTEHYGFYTYFDRSLYVSSVAGSTIPSKQSSTSTTSGGNVPLDEASAVCTWSQTRFLVQIWTRKTDVSYLNATEPTNIPAIDFSANDMSFPGSFPYPVTITIDRHGGEPSEKAVYCHALDSEHHVEQNVRTWIAENRGFGGSLVNPAAVPMNNGTSLSKRSPGGIDGGSGGCSCSWQNF